MPRKPSLSRRSLLRGAAGASAAGLAAGALGASATSAVGASATSAVGASTAGAAAPGTAQHTGPLIVHVRDARTGDIEVYAGTAQTRLRDRDLAARIAGAVR